MTPRSTASVYNKWSSGGMLGVICMRRSIFLSSALVAMFTFVSPALAQYPFPEGSTLAQTGRVTAGGTLVVSGGGFKRGSLVRCEVNGTVVDTVTVSAAGTFFCEITVPSNLAGRTLSVRAVGVDPSGAPKVQTLEANVLAATGSDGKSVLYIALAAILAGGLLVVLGKRRACAVA